MKLLNIQWMNVSNTLRSVQFLEILELECLFVYLAHSRFVFFQYLIEFGLAQHRNGVPFFLVYRRYSFPHFFALIHFDRSRHLRQLIYFYFLCRPFLLLRQRTSSLILFGFSITESASSFVLFLDSQQVRRNRRQFYGFFLFWLCFVDSQPFWDYIFQI